MKIGYVRVSTVEQNLDLQIDALVSEGVARQHIYSDVASGRKQDRAGLDSCIKALRPGDTLLVWKLDRLSRNLHHLVQMINDLAKKEIAFKVLSGHGADIDTTSASGKLIFTVFAALAEFERDVIAERTKAGLAAAKARGRHGGRKPKLDAFAVAGVEATAAQALESRDKDFTLGKAAKTLNVHRSTLWRARKRSAATAIPLDGILLTE